MGQLTKTVRFVVSTDTGETGTSETRTIEGIIQGFDIIYSSDADAGTDIYIRENNAGTIIDVHRELNNSTNKFAAPSRDTTHGNWIADGAYNVYVAQAGGSYNNVVTVIARVVIG